MGRKIWVAYPGLLSDACVVLMLKLALAIELL